MQRLFLAKIYGAIVEAEQINNGTSYRIISPKNVADNWPTMSADSLYELNLKYGPARELDDDLLTDIDNLILNLKLPSLQDRIFFLKFAQQNPKTLIESIGLKARLESYYRDGLFQLLNDFSSELNKTSDIQIQSNLEKSIDIVKDYISLAFPRLFDICSNAIKNSGIFAYDSKNKKQNLSNLSADLKIKFST